MRDKTAGSSRLLCAAFQAHGRNTVAAPAGHRDRVRGEPAARRPTNSNSATSDISVAEFGLRIIGAMQPSAARSNTAEHAANDSEVPGVIEM